MTTVFESLHGIVLAAGGSGRLGRSKQTLMHYGETLLARARRQALAVCGSGVCVVLGADGEKFQPHVEGRDTSAVINPNWRSGMSTSIGLGIGALPADTKAVLITLLDQVDVTEESLRRLATAWQNEPGRITASRYDSVIGVPAIFPRNAFNRLKNLEGDRGARDLLRGHAEDLVIVDMPEAAVDVDTVEDLGFLNS